MNLTLILGILKEGLTLWNSKEASKYLDKVIKLEKEYYEHLSKPESKRSQRYLDKRLHELEIISENFIKYPSKNK